MSNEQKPPSHFEQVRDWLALLAMTPGWWHYSKNRATELEEESVTHGHGLYLGLRQAVKAELQRQKFRPSPQELRSLEEPDRPACKPLDASRPAN